MFESELTQAGAGDEPTDSQYRALLDISESIARHRDFAALMRDLSRHLRTVVRFDGIAIFLHDSAQGKMRMLVLESNIDPRVPLPDEFPAEDAPGGWVWQNQQPMIVNDSAQETRFAEANRMMRENGLKSYCMLPLTSVGRRLGAIGFASLQEAAYSQSDLEFMQKVANQVAVAVDNALNFESAQAAQHQLTRERDRLQLLLEVSNAVTAHLDLRKLFTAISASLGRVIDMDAAGMTLYDQESGQLRAFALQPHLPVGVKSPVEEGHLFSMEDTPGARAIASRQTVLVTRADLENSSSPIVRQIAADGIKSGCVAPLISHGRVLGTLDVVSLREDAFTKQDVDLLTQIAGQIAIAVDNAQVYSELSQIKNKLAEEKLYLEEEINTAYDFEQIIGSSTALKRILKQVETVAPTDSTVLIHGETGTGKELIARAIHSLSARRERTLVKLNCAAIPTGLLESELFGHERGAFTGAIAQRIGRFELANKGTLFLDEVGEIPQELQPKLLRVLQEQEFERLGGTRTIRVDIRLIAATNRKLDQMVAERQFREDLYYRFNVFPITIPPLRERREDIPLLVRFFASKFARRMKKRIETIPSEAVAALEQYHWPGNIRELGNYVERAVILTQGTELQFQLAELKLPARPAKPTTTSYDAATPASPVELTSLESVEREHILRVLKETDWIVGGPNGAAARLGLKRTTLQARMKKLGLARHRAAP
jgi:formate hydrogenlyase transcriptional activator